MAKTMQQIINTGEAISHPLRLKILYMLAGREWYVYELAKELNVSRQVLYLHLKRLEKAGFVESDLRLEDEDQRAKKFFKLVNFDIDIDLTDLNKLFEKEST
ncbi:MAG: winged helix-turn-helix domain-containing protein [Methanosarcinaceae archaeon]|nr:winged helix-turn-helix domain-containing protein [Methanosarcinaceae archaeon]